MLVVLNFLKEDWSLKLKEVEHVKLLYNLLAWFSFLSLTMCRTGYDVVSVDKITFSFRRKIGVE